MIGGCAAHGIRQNVPRPTDHNQHAGRIDWTKRLRRGMGGAVLLSCTDWQEIDHRRILI